MMAAESSLSLSFLPPSADDGRRHKRSYAVRRRETWTAFSYILSPVFGKPAEKCKINVVKAWRGASLRRRPVDSTKVLSKYLGAIYRISVLMRAARNFHTVCSPVLGVPGRTSE